MLGIPGFTIAKSMPGSAQRPDTDLRPVSFARGTDFTDRFPEIGAI